MHSREFNVGDRVRFSFPGRAVMAELDGACGTVMQKGAVWETPNGARTEPDAVIVVLDTALADGSTTKYVLGEIGECLQRV